MPYEDDPLLSDEPMVQRSTPTFVNELEPLSPDQMTSRGSTTLGVTEMKGSWFIFDRYYAHQDWDSSIPWDPTDPPANFDGAAFGGASNAATPGLKWRWAVEVFDSDLGSNPTETPATAGLSVDNLNLAYDQYHADEQIGSCTVRSEVIGSFRHLGQRPVRSLDAIHFPSFGDIKKEKRNKSTK